MGRCAHVHRYMKCLHDTVFMEVNKLAAAGGKRLRIFTPIAMCNIGSVAIPVYTSPSVIGGGMCFVYKKLFVS